MDHPPPIHAFTIATLPNSNLDSVKRVFAENGDILHILGQHEQCAKKDIFGFKLQYLKEFIAPLADTDIVLYMDAYDTIPCGTLGEIRKRFLDLDVPILFAAEKGCWPDAFRSFHYPRRIMYEFPYLNAGAFMGYVGAFKRILATKLVEEREDDQRFWTSQFLDVPKTSIHLDHMGHVFFCGYQVPEAAYTAEERGQFTYKDSTPLLLHCNGDSKFHLPLLWKKLYAFN
jgi:hypothetical protein